MTATDDGRPGGRAAAQPAPADVRTWTITEVAREFDVTLRTLRFYEDRGLIGPERRGTQRLFHPRDRVRLSLVLRGRRLGFTLEQIRQIVDMYDEPPGEAGQLRYVLQQIEARRGQLERRRNDIAETLAELDALERRCRADLAGLAPVQRTPVHRTPADGGRAGPPSGGADDHPRRASGRSRLEPSS